MGEFIGDERRLNPDAAATEVARQAAEGATLRFRSGPLYYNPLPTRRAPRMPRLGRQESRVRRTPPTGAGFMETADHHYFSAVNPSPKIYGGSSPPKTATQLTAPWASLQYQQRSGRHRSRSTM